MPTLGVVTISIWGTIETSNEALSSVMGVKEPVTTYASNLSGPSLGSFAGVAADSLPVVVTWVVVGVVVVVVVVVLPLVWACWAEAVLASKAAASETTDRYSA